MNSLPPQAALTLIDVQQGFDGPEWGNRNNPQAEDNMAALLEAWRRTQRPVIHVRHDSVMPNSPLRPGQPGNAIKAAVKPTEGEPLFTKHVNSAFIGTELEAYLREHNIDTLVVVGLTTNHCISTTARMAGNLGFDTYVVSDATATFDREGPDGQSYPAETVHAISLANLHEEFATVIDTQSLLDRLA